VTPPALSLPGPFATGHYWTALAAYLSRGEFEQGFLDGHGPAQVGLGPPFGGPHRLRLSQRHLRLTQAAGAAGATKSRKRRNAAPVCLATGSIEQHP
jgi:hypothetical protein